MTRILNAKSWGFHTCVAVFVIVFFVGNVIRIRRVRKDFVFAPKSVIFGEVWSSSCVELTKQSIGIPRSLHASYTKYDVRDEVVTLTPSGYGREEPRVATMFARSRP